MPPAPLKSPRSPPLQLTGGKTLGRAPHQVPQRRNFEHVSATAPVLLTYA